MIKAMLSKLTFDPNMKIKKSNPARRKSFEARHNCDNPGPKTKARYWVLETLITRNMKEYNPNTTAHTKRPKKRTSMGHSNRTRPKNKNKRRQYKNI